MKAKVVRDFYFSGKNLNGCVFETSLDNFKQYDIIASIEPFKQPIVIPITAIQVSELESAVEIEFFMDAYSHISRCKYVVAIFWGTGNPNILLEKEECNYSESRTFCKTQYKLRESLFRKGFGSLLFKSLVEEKYRNIFSIFKETVNDVEIFNINYLDNFVDKFYNLEDALDKVHAMSRFL